MPDSAPLSLEQVLAEERKTLRPDTLTPMPLSALCISGGGIRSATFALGAVQGLAERGLLSEFDYLSTVSGGGYLGAWLGSWIKRDGLAKVIPRLQHNALPPGPGEANPIQHLREYNNYLSPKLGFLSADTWTLIATVLRNISLNWLVLVPLLMFVLMIPRLMVSIDSFAVPQDSTWARFGLPGLMMALFAYAGVFQLHHLPGVGGRDHSQEKFLLHCNLPLATGAVVFSVYNSFYEVALRETVLWMVSPCVAGWLVYLMLCRKPWRERVGLIFGSMTLAIVLMGLSIAGASSLIGGMRPPLTSWATWVAFGPPILFLGFNFAVGIFVGLSSGTLQDPDREWIARCSAWVLLTTVGWASICTLVLLAPKWALEWNVWGKSALAAAGALSGWLGVVKGASTSGKGEQNSVRDTAMDKLIKVAPFVFLGVFSIGLSLLTNIVLSASGALWNAGGGAKWFQHDLLLEQTPWYVAFGAAVFFLVVSWLMARYININKFSLHGMYRDRLIRAFLGASNPQRQIGQTGGKPPNSFTGFTESDNFQMAELANQRPLHIVNVTLNLVSGQRLAWQQRKAQSFTISPLHCGNPDVMYRPAEEFGGPKGISLGTAIAISGAAASPNMGYHSSPAVGFLMTLFNSRLGCWLGNPRLTETDTWKEAGPRSAIRSIVKEALGMTDNESEYIYLSDGGHFENLALYEMVQRRCQTIILLDSSGDPDFKYEDLGNAIRKIRIDQRIPITFPEGSVRGLRDGKKRAAIANIEYSCVDASLPNGKLIYVKPMILGNESPDVATYAKGHAVFPHQSTADQWFDESQTESYRMLGYHTIEEVCGGGTTGPLAIADLAAHIEREYLGIGAAAV